MSDGMAEAAKPAALTPDICIIGAGRDGIALAIAASAFGVPVVLVERGTIGGSPGPLAARALVAAAAGAGPDPVRIHDHIQRALATERANHTAERLTALGIRIVRGQARFTSRSTVTVERLQIKARRFVIATGARPAPLAIPGLDTLPVLDEAALAGLTRLPERPIVLGGGGTGAALAQALNRFGCATTLIAPEGLLPDHDAEAVALLRRRLTREGLDIHEGRAPLRAERSRSGLRLVLAGPAGEATVEGSHLLACGPLQPAIGGLDLDLGGIRHDASGVSVDKGLRTSNRRVHALGACAGGAAAAAPARAGDDHVGLLLRTLLFRQPVRIDPVSEPRIVWSRPEIAAIGLTEEEARARAGTIRVLRWPFSENAAAQASGETEGFVKAITDRKGRILGAVIVGDEAGELIAPWCVAMRAGLGIGAVAGLPLPAMGRSDASRSAALSFHAPLTTRPALRRLIGFLRRFG
ncbi:FAD-dependent oxidoreductase [Bosea sp. (in: a-proteobacteria)]|uniref:FAD-dependent oxidoreductase n=1 Tax=Bosea sp. (in: a-proteobacteria) TaxID=1871050 RepID=UPI0026395CDE|nr:FAD-dependent oxidoreductase [Bosea sp. (in: a-proteobacteria)]MCO5091780.1 FAD-dependent oxidoreductase [Bosea sp. (in: a-proteobacteria)]